MQAPTIVYQDADVVVIDKPAGLMVHSDGVSNAKTLVDWIEETYPEMVAVGEAETLRDGTRVMRPGVVHRLDRETSGVLILARTPEAHAHLKQQFMDHAAKKTYRAFVYGPIARERGVIDFPIGKGKKDFRQWSASRSPRGTVREARTDFKVLARSDLATYVEAFPQTGRTHQIRVHFKAIQHPVVCDGLYAPARECILGFSRLALHALSLSLTLPSGEEKTFTAPLPPEFVEAEKRLS